MLIPFKELFARHQVKTSGVLHLGANLGQEAEAYVAQGITQVIWVEALPLIFAKLCANCQKYTGHIALMACVSDVDDQDVTFHIANNGGQSSSFLEFGTHTKAHPSVTWTSHMRMKTQRVDTLLRRAELSVGPDWFLNIDLQGAELKALKGMGELLRQFKYAYIEVNEDQLYRGCPLVGEVDNYLARYGFVGKERKMTNWKWGDKFYIRS